MNILFRFVCVTAIIAALGSAAPADDFGAGDNQFTIDFTPISAATNPASGYGIVTDNYRIGVYEITNDQWDKFENSLSPTTVTGVPSGAYDEAPEWPETLQPASNVSYYEAAQFVNWLNTSTGRHAAYNFTGTQGTANYALDTWDAEDAYNGSNLYRHKDAFYFLPTEDEWVKAGYWNGTTLQLHATKAGESLHQGNATTGTGWFYDDSGVQGVPSTAAWAVGGGSEELNGTFDIMGNMWEWMESPYSDTNYGANSKRGLRGGGYLGSYGEDYVVSSHRSGYDPDSEYVDIGFRVASVPEPCSLGLFALGGLLMIRKKQKRSRANL